MTYEQTKHLKWGYGNRPTVQHSSNLNKFRFNIHSVPFFLHTFIYKVQTKMSKRLKPMGHGSVWQSLKGFSALCYRSVNWSEVWDWRNAQDGSSTTHQTWPSHQLQPGNTFCDLTSAFFHNNTFYKVQRCAQWEFKVRSFREAKTYFF